MNRIILIIDELYELVKRADDEVKKSILKKIDSFAHQQRAFGIHMVICGQDLDKIDSFDTIKNQCITRIALHCDDEQVKLLMGDAGVARMHTIDSTDQGAGVFSLTGSSNPQIEHTTYLGHSQHEEILQDIHQHYIDKNDITKVKVLLTKISENPNHIISLFVEKGYVSALNNNRLLVGEPISMERDLNLCPMENLWVTGGAGALKQTEAMKAGNSIMFFSAMSLLLNRLKNNNVDILCTNCCDDPMRSVEDEEEDLAGQLAKSSPGHFKYNTGSRLVSSLENLLDQLDDRKGDPGKTQNAIWWLLIRPELAMDLGDESTFVINLKELLKNGPKYNIHTIIWNADVKKSKKFQLQSFMFRDRICLDMPSDDIKAVNGSEIKPAPEGYKAACIGTSTQRFRVYDLPDGKWMNRLFETLRNF